MQNQENSNDKKQKKLAEALRANLRRRKTPPIEGDNKAHNQDKS